jgi:hypothetical protein
MPAEPPAAFRLDMEGDATRTPRHPAQVRVASSPVEGGLVARHQTVGRGTRPAVYGVWHLRQTRSLVRLKVESNPGGWGLMPSPPAPASA